MVPEVCSARMKRTLHSRFSLLREYFRVWQDGVKIFCPQREYLPKREVCFASALQTIARLILLQTKTVT